MESVEGIMKLDQVFYKDKIVLVTGHTGFKGTWLCKMLINFGAHVIGYSLKAPTDPNVFEISNIENKMVSIIGDIRDFDKLYGVFEKYKPDIVFHLAAQPIVRDSYKNPRYTYETNVMGTCNVLECIRLTNSVKSFLNVTTDKVYQNNEIKDYFYNESDKLDGYDPYSNSKSCSELVTHSYQKSFFNERHISISTARAGNVIGGGDFANDRIVPDSIRAISRKEKIFVRNPNSIRPYQYVLEPLYAYLLICEAQYFDFSFCGSYNIGPEKSDCISTGDLVSKLCKKWGNDLQWYTTNNEGPHEANYLNLNCDKFNQKFNCKPTFHIDDAINEICEWTNTFFVNKREVDALMDREIFEFLESKND
jgi:CDP-glucose 4,6-dehydratase